MKTNNILAIAVVIAVSIFGAGHINAQKIKSANVPAAILAGFKSAFPKATKPTWELENSSMYEVDFRQSKKEYSAKFDVNGNLVETETSIKMKAVPSQVSQSLKSQFKGYKIESAEKILYPDGSTAYEFGIEKGKESLELLFSSDGTLLKQEAEEEDGDEDKDKRHK
jgi:hypothetical protein